MEKDAKDAYKKEMEKEDAKYVNKVLEQEQLDYEKQDYVYPVQPDQLRYLGMGIWGYTPK